MRRRNFIRFTATAGALVGAGLPITQIHASETSAAETGQKLNNGFGKPAENKPPDGDPVEFFVSPAGSDSNPGTLGMPFKTLQHARDKVQLINKSSAANKIIVWLSRGEYQLSETLVFNLSDSAKPGQTITYSALDGEVPVISSDMPIANWKRFNGRPKGLPKKSWGKLWVAEVPPEMDFKVLYNSHGMLPRAKTGAIAHLRKYDDWVGPDDYRTTIPFRKETVDALFNPRQAEIAVVGAAPWTMNILPVKSVDLTNGIVQLNAASTYALAQPRFYFDAKTIWVENTFAGLDSPGKWVLDKQAGKLYLWPESGDKPTDIVAPKLTELIRVEGKINYDGAEDEPVYGLCFKGLTFTRGDRYSFTGATGWGLQHDWERFDAPTAMVRFRGARECCVEGCKFINSAGAALRFDLYAQRNRVIRNQLSNLGGAGILLAGYGPGTKDVNKNNIISNNHIHHTGMLWWHSLGIWAWQSGYNQITHNTLHNLSYTAIAVTGRINWDPKGIAECSRTVRWAETDDFNGSEVWEERERFLHARHNTIEANDIRAVMEVMQDGNGIYISGTGSGNIACGNFVHDTPSMAAGEGIRCDDDQNEVLLENNVVYKHGTHGIGICTKGRNHIVNNIVACPPNRVNRGMLSLETGNKNIAGSRILHNIFYATQPNQPFVYHDGIEPCSGLLQMNNNIYFNTSNPKAAGDYLAWSVVNGIDTDSLQADPLFTDPLNGDFTLKPGSPALKLGFRPFKLNAGIIRP